MELMQGYKQTEVGLIPEDWEVKSIDQIFSFYSTSNYSKAQMTLEGDVGCLHYGLIHAIKNSYYNVKSGIKYYVNMKQAKYEFVVDGDIVMVDASEDLSGVNKSVEITGIGNKLYISGLHTFLLRDRGFLAEYFRGSILNSNIAKTQMLRLAVGMKVYGVSKPQIKTVLLPVPPFHEQTAIANALSDMDELISQTEKLIEKKKAIKQGAMQELLKPKEGWETKQLGDFNFNISDGNYSSKYPKASEFKEIGIPFIRANNIKRMTVISDDMRFISKQLHAELQKGHLQVDDILITTRGEIGKIALVPDSQVGSNINAQIVRINTNGKINTKYLAYFFMKNETQKVFQNAQTGSALKQLPVNKLKEILITYPKEHEQKDIATILYDMDFQIFELESKLDKLKQQKQGMMQALLTGKIRIVS
jgi:type I restriction enzyme S subunit